MQKHELSVEIIKSERTTSSFAPLEQGTIVVMDEAIAQVVIEDSTRRSYIDRRVKKGDRVEFRARGTAGQHCVYLLDGHGNCLNMAHFRVAPSTRLWCDKGPYAKLGERIMQLLSRAAEQKALLINGRLYRMLVTWGRDHVHTLKAQKYFMQDVTSGMDYWMQTQEPSGMLWDCVHPNPDYPGRTWFGEALGEGYFRYDDNMKYIVRRIPVEADCEFLYTEGVWYAWKATGDDIWMARQLPRLEKALKYNSSHPTRWSEKHQLVRRSFCMDSWDFVNSHYCNGDHRCINPGDPQFLFHSDNSGLYASYWRMAEMYEHLGEVGRAKALRAEGEALRKRANRKLFFGSIYGHMIPEELPEEQVYRTVGDERKRMSLSTGYTINRGLPTHEMSVKILKEYQRRGRQKKRESFAEWWTMDPPYTREQWPKQGPPVGEYMNGAICSIIAGEIAKAAFDHGMEDYGADILRRIWDLSERDGGELHQVYRRLPENPKLPKAKFAFVDLAAVVNRGLKHKAHPTVPAWTEEGENDLRKLPVGRQRFGEIEFVIVDPGKNDGRAVLRLDNGGAVPSNVTVPVANLAGRSIYFLHALAHSAPQSAIVGRYEIYYADGVTNTIYLRNGIEINNWWGVSDEPAKRGGRANPVDRNITRVAWRGANPTWANVGLYMTGWNNPRPEVPVTAIRAIAEPVGGRGGGIMLAGISFSDQPVEFEPRIRSYGLPDNWAQAAVYYAIAEGLSGIEDTGAAFSSARISPRWGSTEATEAQVTLHYPASDGYCAYEYHDNRRGKITLDITGSFDEVQLRCLLPQGKKLVRVKSMDMEITADVETIERSKYVVFTLNGLPLEPLVIEYR